MIDKNTVIILSTNLKTMALHQKFDSDGMVFTQINIQKVGWFDDNNILKVFTANVRSINDCG